jgi:hypothetical protein
MQSDRLSRVENLIKAAQAAQQCAVPGDRM